MDMTSRGNYSMRAIFTIPFWLKKTSHTPPKKNHYLKNKIFEKPATTHGWPLWCPSPGNSMDRILVTCPAAEADAASRCWPHCQNPEVLSWSLPWEQLHGGWGVMITHLLLGGVCSAGVVLKLVRDCGLETVYQWLKRMMKYNLR